MKKYIVNRICKLIAYIEYKKGFKFRNKFTLSHWFLIQCFIIKFQYYERIS